MIQKIIITFNTETEELSIEAPEEKDAPLQKLFYTAIQNALEDLEDENSTRTD